MQKKVQIRNSSIHWGYIVFIKYLNFSRCTMYHVTFIFSEEWDRKTEICDVLFTIGPWFRNSWIFLHNNGCKKSPKSFCKTKKGRWWKFHHWGWIHCSSCNGLRYEFIKIFYSEYEVYFDINHKLTLNQFYVFFL